MEPIVAEQALVGSLLALASETRLAILRQLRQPRTLREIVVRERTELSEGPPLARQTVRRHLDVLIAAGLVTTRSGEREYGDTTEFVVNHQRLYDLSEEARALARLRPTVEPEQRTSPAHRAAKPEARGPCLILVKGLDEGARFPLAGGPEWVVGRRRGVAVPLDYDAAVSGENAIVRATSHGHTIEDVAGSRNGTAVNHRLLEPGERVPLARGDIIGVGRSALVYWR